MPETKSKELVVFIGCKNFGKNWNAKPYIEAGYKEIAFADSLRDMLWNILGFKPSEDFTYDEMKKSKLITHKVKRFLKIFNIKKTIEVSTFRILLQNLGSVMKKTFGDNFWVNIWYKKVLESDCNIVTTDIRLPNEIKKALTLIKSNYNVKFVWCCYSGANFQEILKDTHESEQLAQYMYWNQDKYSLFDGCPIDIDTINKILKDYSKFQKSKNRLSNLQ